MKYTGNWDLITLFYPGNVNSLNWFFCFKNETFFLCLFYTLQVFVTLFPVTGLFRYCIIWIISKTQCWFCLLTHQVSASSSSHRNLWFSLITSMSVLSFELHVNKKQYRSSWYADIEFQNKNTYLMFPIKGPI